MVPEGTGKVAKVGKQQRILPSYNVHDSNYQLCIIALWGKQWHAYRGGNQQLSIKT